ncbi:MAG: hypothetical protein LKM40_06430 [Mageeibacillus sp.]|nr:hypothetical protein [Mageeibacillus sp.]
MTLLRKYIPISGLFTASESFGEDAFRVSSTCSQVFSIPQSWRRLIPAPLWMKDYFSAEDLPVKLPNAKAGKPRAHHSED